MTAATIAPAGAAEAHAVLDMAVTARWPEDGVALIAVWTAILRLDCALMDCRVRPGDAAAEKVARFARELHDVMYRNCGPGWGGAR